MPGKVFASVPTYNGRAVVLVAKSAEIDAGASPLDEVEVSVTDADVIATSAIYAQVSMSAAPTGKDADDVPMDTYVCWADPMGATGSFTVRLRSLDGQIHDRYVIDYLIA